jgi:hypothetical protein
MFIRSWFAQLQLARTFQYLQREWRRTPRRRRESHFYLPAQVLEVRSLLSAYTAASVSALVADIAAANKAGGANTITLAANTTFDLTAVNNTTNGANGLPVIGATKAVNLTIVGNGDTIDRSAAAGTPAFRLFDVASGSSLTLESVTLQNGLAKGQGTAADGGAIYNQGRLTLIGATVQNNAAEGTSGANGLVTKSQQQSSSINGQAGGSSAGGGIWSSGSVTLEGGTIVQQNQALGGQGGAAGAYLGNHSEFFGVGNGGVGGAGLGGGLYEVGGSVIVTNATLASNTAAGGAGGAGYELPIQNSWRGSSSAGAGGLGAGGGLYASGSTLNASSVVVQANQALGGVGGAAYQSSGAYEGGGTGGAADGGGIDVAGGTATLVGSQLVSNEAQGGNGGNGGNGGVGGNSFGGGLDAGGGTLSLTNDTVTENDASAGSGGAPDWTGPSQSGTAAGGGIEIAAAAAVSLDLFTVNNTNNNVINRYKYNGDSLSNIDGTYIVLP